MKTFSRNIKLNDYNRILLSDTAPFDVPIIFSNNSFYKKIEVLENKSAFLRSTFDYLFTPRKLDKYTIPMRYKIRKSDFNYRHMGLLHPSSQLMILEFYKSFSHQIIHYCSQSTYSIRRPKKVASFFFVRNAIENNHNLRTGAAESVSDENKYRHATSYFSYDRYTRLYQFFESEEYLNLETKYTDFWSLDISKCFESIYTHSIEWATKSKFISKDFNVKDSFGAIFDKLMQKSNYNETNGIIIGNEFSRIFAEVILQAVDRKTLEMLEKIGIRENEDYDIRRYVDDYFIFANSGDTAQKVTNILEDNLRQYKLHLNSNKTKKLTKPFITKITKSKIETSKAIDELYNILFSYEDKKIKINPKRIRRNHHVIKSFLNRIKAACSDDIDSYNVMTGYVLSAFLNNVKKITDSITDENRSNFSSSKNAFVIILRIAFHLFSVNPSNSNSIKLSSLMYLSFVFFEKNFKEEDETIKLLINSFIKDFFSSGKCKQLLDNSYNYFSIEFANLLFVSRNMGTDFLLTPKQIDQIFDLDAIESKNTSFAKEEENSDYFRLMAFLYYVGDEQEYNRLKERAVKLINQRLSNLSAITKDAKLSYLALDSIACPYIDEKVRTKWACRLFKEVFGKEIPLSDKSSFFKAISEEEWFISWKHPELWNLLEKKELHFDY
ncbi:MAG: hypothetical protein CMH22_12200 [Methylophaga sp.]|uniref:antiviral reverse transcriptase Drt3b n=1 Tax=Methylophaga sp. UBA678 TaxID=1946901 RepID=UPI000C5DCDEE|nr:antiviral reverse transcriptase Drt3b [Methylophaga sp. UBA678]MAX52736.1 hypothetical protein [Methylophaga sp.]|tara:strand:+ start:25471 stop:27468 length:1998 start_codon:yes stop_codon:yes gene_type:complete